MDENGALPPDARAELIEGEIVDSALARDRDVKRLLYARHGTPEFRIVDIGDERVLTFREPSSDQYLQALPPEGRAVVATSAGCSLPSPTPSLADVPVLSLHRRHARRRASKDPAVPRLSDHDRGAHSDRRERRHAGSTPGRVELSAQRRPRLFDALPQPLPRCGTASRARCVRRNACAVLSITVSLSRSCAATAAAPDDRILQSARVSGDQGTR